ncbi:Hypothetical protein GL50581_1822 [Giardia duodenalis ATCC 50581]|uniref:Tetratricopeptide repeat protein n=1 Tax=Giardia intestinalis (strain ATCC 50581 / GS clone H7) TaxID=598745 RepID=C6LSS9_GIAIB|nr:Hypothetical protein GL50581_1822 [Giardia intestinalis ATCC 50581]
MGKTRQHNPVKRKSQPSSGSVSELISQAYAKLETGNFAKALTLAERALPLCNQPTVLDSLGEIFSVAGDFQKASNCYAKALGYDHLTHSAGLRYMTLYEITGDPANLNSAIGIFRKHPGAEESRSSLILALAALADAYLTRLDPPDIKAAIRTAKEAINIDPSYIEPHISLAGAHLVAESFDLAEKAALCALGLMEQRGLYKIERTENGDEEITVHSDDNQPAQQFLLSLSRICAGIGMYEQGAMCCDLVLAQNPKDAVALHDLAWCYNLAGEYEDAKEALLQVKDIYLEENAADDLIVDIDAKIQALSANPEQV